MKSVSQSSLGKSYKWSRQKIANEQIQSKRHLDTKRENICCMETASKSNRSRVGNSRAGLTVRCQPGGSMILMKSKQNIKLETCHTVLPVTPSCTRLVQEGLVVSLHYFLAQSSLSMPPCHTSLTHPWLFLPPPNPVPGKHIIAQTLETLEITSGLRSKML